MTGRDTAQRGKDCIVGSVPSVRETAPIASSPKQQRLLSTGAIATRFYEGVLWSRRRRRAAHHQVAKRPRTMAATTRTSATTWRMWRPFGLRDQVSPPRGAGGP